MSYAPLDSGVLFSTTIKEGPVVFAVWCAILASKDQDGFTELNPETLVGLMSNPLEGKIADYGAIKSAWETLAGPDEGSKNQDHQGRRIIPTPDGRWWVVSHEKYRLKHSKAVREEQLRQAKQRQRAREKAAAEQKCAVCLEGPVVGAVQGALLCEKHFAEDSAPDDEAPI